MMEFILVVRVYYEDTDSGGVVYHSNYLKYMERARTEWLRSLGIEQDTLAEKEGVLFAVRSAQVEYLKPARLDQSLDITVEVEKLGAASLTFKQQVRLKQQEGQQAEQILCTGKFKVACVTRQDMRPVAIPLSIKSEIMGER